MISTFRETFAATDLWSFSLTTLVLRMSLSFCYGNFYLSVILNSAYAMSSLFFVRNAKGVCHIEDVVPLSSMIFSEAVILFFLVCASDVADRYFRFQIIATRLQGEGAASTRLLELMCDVMVELDSDGCLSAHSERLAALVAMDPSIDMKGSKLEKFMPLAEDRSRFENLLTATCGKKGGLHPNMMHATFRDSFRSRFSVEIYCVAFRDIHDFERFYIGLQESRDVPLAELKGLRRAKKRRSQHFFREQRAESDQTSDGLKTEIEHHDSSESEASTPGNQPDDVLLNPRWQRTQRAAQMRSLWLCIQTWNFSTPTSACCAHHAALRETTIVVNNLRKRKCSSRWKSDFSAQCWNCGVLADWNDGDEYLECVICGIFMTRSEQILSL
eukprot:TRINITY_DN54304_c0_g1_i1.p1 TRINITY_DN54304_c0_g1~~TRINITY_DN54304_c0_g1_i1.p1  ORF type:complete len:410 (-),score=43.34 TRINITY_DN54304_c0_g1_i1:142-1299(-)